MRLTTDASTIAIAGALEQLIDGEWRPLGFYSRKLKDPETRYSTFDRELLAVHESLLNYRTWLGSNECIVYTDHKPLIFVLAKGGDRANERQCRHLDLISQYITEIRFIKGTDNVVADALSRTDEMDPEAVVAAIVGMDETAPATRPSLALHHDWAKAQIDDAELLQMRDDKRLLWTPLRIDDGLDLWCEMSTGSARPYIPAPFRWAIFDAAHSVAHGGQRATKRAVHSKYIWKGVSQDIGYWVRACDGCARYKPARPPASAYGVFPIPSGRCRHVHLDIVGPLPSVGGKQYVLTFIDRFTRWPEAAVLPSITASSVARAFISTWVSRYGCPDVITTDR